MHRIRYSFFFFVNMTKIDLEKYTKRNVQCGKQNENKIVRRRKICLILWRTRQNENAPDRKKPVRGI